MTSGLLGLVGIDGDRSPAPAPRASEPAQCAAWSAGESTLPMLLQRIQTPPMRRLGVMDVDTVIAPTPALPGGAAQRDPGHAGVPGLLRRRPARPAAPAVRRRRGDRRFAVVTVAHLSDAERQLVISRVLASVIRWFAPSPAPTACALVYIDGCGLRPPTAIAAHQGTDPDHPSNRPGRSGSGWCWRRRTRSTSTTRRVNARDVVGQAPTQTERDKARLLEGMAPPPAAVDVSRPSTRRSPRSSGASSCCTGPELFAPLRFQCVGRCRTCRVR